MPAVAGGVPHADVAVTGRSTSVDDIPDDAVCDGFRFLGGYKQGAANQGGNGEKGKGLHGVPTRAWPRQAFAALPMLRWRAAVVVAGRAVRRVAALPATVAAVTNADHSTTRLTAGVVHFQDAPSEGFGFLGGDKQSTRRERRDGEKGKGLHGAVTAGLVVNVATVQPQARVMRLRMDRQLEGKRVDRGMQRSPARNSATGSLGQARQSGASRSSQLGTGGANYGGTHP